MFKVKKILVLEFIKIPLLKSEIIHTDDFISKAYEMKESICANQPLALRRTVAKWRFQIFAYLFVNLSKLAAYEMNSLKLNYHKKVFYFALNFLPSEILLIKKVGF